MATIGTFALVSDSYDGRDNYSGDTWPPPIVSSETVQIQCSCGKNGSSPLYSESRAFFAFNTSTIPDESLILSGTLQFWINSKDTSLSNSAIIVVPCVAGGATYTFTNLGSANGTNAATGAYTSINLDVATNPINKAGTTGLGLMEWHRFVNSAPGSIAASAFTISDAGDATNQPAKLIVVYDNATGLDTTAKMW